VAPELSIHHVDVRELDAGLVERRELLTEAQ
jgi:hypothetical protein